MPSGAQEVPVMVVAEEENQIGGFGHGGTDLILLELKSSVIDAARGRQRCLHRPFPKKLVSRVAASNNAAKLFSHFKGRGVS
jgi:hypothetical protein